MSDIPMQSGQATRPRTRWGWFVALGVVMMLLGVWAWLDVVTVTLFGTIFIGAALLVGGVLEVVHAFMDRDWGGFLWHVLAGILYVIAGALIMAEPIRGALIVTIVVAVVMIVAGISRIVLAVRHWHMGGAGLLLLGGIVSVLVGIALYLTLPWSGLWVVGTLIAVELIVRGAAWFELGLGLRRAR